jgi:hypothetical protein
MPSSPLPPDDACAISHPRWSRTDESDGFFVDEDRLRGGFYALAAASACLLALLAAGLWRLQRAALAPPVFVGIADGRVFSGDPEPVSGIRDSDFDPQLKETVEVLFSRTEKGLPPALGDFVASDVLAAVDAGYRDAAAKYPAGYAQTLAILESKLVAGRPGYRRVRYRGLLSSRSIAAAQTSPIYLECVFTTGRPGALNAAGWRLVRLTALGRDDYYQDERERAVRRALQLP